MSAWDEREEGVAMVKGMGIRCGFDSIRFDSIRFGLRVRLLRWFVGALGSTDAGRGKANGVCSSRMRLKKVE
jgi:hypothetical protein